MFKSLLAVSNDLQQAICFQKHYIFLVIVCTPQYKSFTYIHSLTDMVHILAFSLSSEERFYSIVHLNTQHFYAVSLQHS